MDTLKNDGYDYSDFSSKNMFEMKALRLRPNGYYYDCPARNSLVQTLVQTEHHCASLVG